MRKMGFPPPARKAIRKVSDVQLYYSIFPDKRKGMERTGPGNCDGIVEITISNREGGRQSVI